MTMKPALVSGVFHSNKRLFSFFISKWKSEDRDKEKIIIIIILLRVLRGLLVKYKDVDID